MKGRVLYRNNKEVVFDMVERVEIRSGIVIVFGYVEVEEKSFDYVEIIEPLEKISLIKTWEE